VNWGKFKSDGIGMSVELEPPASFVGLDGRDLTNMGVDWVVRMFPRADVVTIQHVETSAIAELGKDHIYDFRTNPMRSTQGERHGFLVLKVQVFVEGETVRLRPNRSPGESVAATERIAQLEREAAKLRSAIRPRRLHQSQRDIIVSALHGQTFEVWIGTIDTDPEAMALWQDLTAALQDAGLKVVPHTSWARAQGVCITPVGGQDREKLKAAFLAAGVELWDCNGEGARLTRLEIVVGSKPPAVV
jgi:hypothetical protein